MWGFVGVPSQPPPPPGASIFFKGVVVSGVQCAVRLSRGRSRAVTSLMLMLSDVSESDDTVVSRGERHSK